MTFDLNSLGSWYQDDTQPARKIMGDDGRQKLQVKVRMGILQLEVDGRPDGQRFKACDSALIYYKDALRAHEQLPCTETDFSLSREDCAHLFEENKDVYLRYVHLLKLTDYERVVRDTERSMELYKFVNQYAADEQDKTHLERLWPYTIQVNCVAKSMVARKQGDYDAALLAVSEATQKLEELTPLDTDEFSAQVENARQTLEGLEKAFLREKPKTRREIKLETLTGELDRAVDREEFERAAELRDEILALEAQEANT